jgi:excinuclease UvrABC ATPase subunit
LFFFNSPVGACKGCEGLGTINEWPWANGDKILKAEYPQFFGDKYATVKTCKECNVGSV